MAYELIETITVGAGGVASIEFTSIPQDGTDLVLVNSLRGTDATVILSIDPQINNDSGQNYEAIQMTANSSSVTSSFTTSSRSWLEFASGDSAFSAIFGSTTVYFSDYTSSLDKIYILDNAVPDRYTNYRQLLAGNLYRTTSPITSLKITPRDPSIAEHSTASLYKITAA